VNQITVGDKNDYGEFGRLAVRDRLTLAQQELVIFTEKMTKQAQEISDYEYEISLLRKQIEGLETEREKDKKKITELEELLAKAREVHTGHSELTCLSSVTGALPM